MSLYLKKIYPRKSTVTLKLQYMKPIKPRSFEMCEALNVQLQRHKQLKYLSVWPWGWISFQNSTVIHSLKEWAVVVTSPRHLRSVKTQTILHRHLRLFPQVLIIGQWPHIKEKKALLIFCVCLEITMTATSDVKGCFGVFFFAGMNWSLEQEADRNLKPPLPSKRRESFWLICKSLIIQTGAKTKR